ncbi:MAG: hypothetical protein ACYTEI_00815 [Planctomycetota bacterium]|jgi:hypothetical protein
MVSLSRRVGCLFLVAGLGGPTALADIAVQVPASAPSNIYPNASTTQGWQFTVSVPIEVTHLGLYDRGLNGFLIDHPIALWDDQATLLAQDVISAGAGDPLIGSFRYVDITDNTAPRGGDPGVVLSPGIAYTVGFYSASLNFDDGMVIFNGYHTINPLINYAGFGVADITTGLQMPTSPDANGLHRWGPNFQFTVVPGAPTMPLLVAAILFRRRRRGERI